MELEAEIQTRAAKVDLNTAPTKLLCKGEDLEVALKVLRNTSQSMEFLRDLKSMD